MNQELYPWLENSWIQLQNALKLNRLPGSLLISSQDGLGEGALVLKLTKTLLCSSSDSEACGFCHSCMIFEAGNHPDFHTIEPEKGKTSIGVEQIRSANKWAMESSQLESYRVIFINRAEMMTASAANAILKTLEEPPASCVFILNTYHSSGLLATIRSRCQSWVLTSPNRHDAKLWCETSLNQPVTELDCLLCDSAPLRIVAFIEEKQNTIALKLIQALVSEFTAISTQHAVLSELKSEPQLKLKWLIMVLSEMQKQKLGIDSVYLESDINILQNRLTLKHLQLMQKTFIQLSHLLETYSGLNSELVIGEQLTTLREEICL